MAYIVKRKDDFEPLIPYGLVGTDRRLHNLLAEKIANLMGFDVLRRMSDELLTYVYRKNLQECEKRDIRITSNPKIGVPLNIFVEKILCGPGFVHLRVGLDFPIADAKPIDKRWFLNRFLAEAGFFEDEIICIHSGRLVFMFYLTGRDMPVKIGTRRYKENGLDIFGFNK